ncbi:MAG: ABC transporter ATP-binding protein [Planctomycetota bacterium]
MNAERAVIAARGLGKRYEIGARGPAGRSLRAALTDFTQRGWRRLMRPRERAAHWALRGVDFSINEGEVVGIVGRNGAGKSTILKLLARITEPSEGEVRLRGRVGSLLEVGAGFHSELTGRENIFLSGSILGMRRQEIVRRFADIVAFAGIEQFIDTPVKHYSSGMYMRLAFAVAAHLDTEILLVDEVLAVGDVQFQKRCLLKMEEVGRHGRTVLFVSHSMPIIVRLCTRALLLEDGHITRDGAPGDVVYEYTHQGKGLIAECEWRERAPADDCVRLNAVRVLNTAAGPCASFDVRDEVVVEFCYEVLAAGASYNAAFICHNQDGVVLFSSADNAPAAVAREDATRAGVRTARCRIPGDLLTEGYYSITAIISSTTGGCSTHLRQDECLRFLVTDAAAGDSARGTFGGEMPGVIRPKLTWDARG